MLSKRAKALSVEEAGPTTSPDPPPPEAAIVIAPAALVIVTFVPAVNVALVSVLPVLLPINS